MIGTAAGLGLDTTLTFGKRGGAQRVIGEMPIAVTGIATMTLTSTLTATKAAAAILPARLRHHLRRFMLLTRRNRGDHETRRRKRKTIVAFIGSLLTQNYLSPLSQPSRPAAVLNLKKILVTLGMSIISS